jgi:RNA polymerase sigma factor (sigma-70 family)
VPAQSILSPYTPSQLLRLSQSAGPNAQAAQDALVDQFGRLLKKIVTRACRSYHLRDQERDDVLSETYQQILNPDIARFATRRGKPQQYFRGIVLNAARKVLTQRDARRRKGTTPGEGPAVAGDQAEEFAGGGRYRSSSPSPPSPAEDTERRDLAIFILEAAPLRVRRALELCYWDQWPLLSIAAHLGVSRFALAREIQAFFHEMIAKFGDD